MLRTERKMPFIKRCDGTTAIEFAVIAPVLFLLLMGIMELGLIFFVYSVLEGATDIGARVGKTGYTSAGISREDYIRRRVRDLSGGFVDNTNISILSYRDFQYIGVGEPCINPPQPPCPGTPNVNFEDVNGNLVWDEEDQGAAGPGIKGSVVLYTVSVPWQIITPIFSHIMGNEIEIKAVATVRNEDFR